MGRLMMQTAPRIIVMMAMTLAKIGCSMKNFDMPSALPDRYPPAAL
jgi:hypothetical protein